jgi:hypothetical protein
MKIFNTLEQFFWHCIYIIVDTVDGRWMSQDDEQIWERYMCEEETVKEIE